jgi:hypothetical protein
MTRATVIHHLSLVVSNELRVQVTVLNGAKEQNIAVHGALRSC